MNKRLIISGIVILFASIIIKLVWSGLTKIKVDNFKPAAVMFVLDSSASNQQDLPEQKKLLRQICNLLDPEDKIKIIRVSEDAYLIYEGAPFNGSNINKVMNADILDIGKGIGNSISGMGKGIAEKMAFLNTDVTDIGKGLSTKWNSLISKVHTNKINKDTSVAELKAMWLAENAAAEAKEVA